MFDPKIYIIFNGGECGDFFTFLILQQRYKLPTESRRILDEGALELERELITKKYFDFLYNNYDFKEDISSYEYDTGNAHYCNKEIIDRFPKCKFYYIDDSKHTQITANAFIKKRILNHNLNLVEWIKINTGNTKLRKIKHINEDIAINIIKKGKLKSIEEWKKLKINRIDFVDILNKEKCKDLVKTIAQVNFDDLLFDRTYDKWAYKNKELIEAVKNSDNLAV